VVAILRARAVEHVEAVVETLAESGLTCVELTFTIPGMPSVLQRLASRLPSGVTIGAGTVTTIEQARAAGRRIGDALTGGDLAALAARARQLMTALRPG
jgi:2-dehydro-3-deoxyphosphogluconate aldolase/(4S)-4-hydroxy-2-oxoglutarate aldolase